MRSLTNCLILALSCQSAMAEGTPLGAAQPATALLASRDVASDHAAPSSRPARQTPKTSAKKKTSPQPLAAPAAERDSIPSLVLDTGSGQVVNLQTAIANVFVADPKVAEVRPASVKTLFVFGAALGAPRSPRWTMRVTSSRNTG